jgi:hypothetical protein
VPEVGYSAIARQRLQDAEHELDGHADFPDDELQWPPPLVPAAEQPGRADRVHHRFDLIVKAARSTTPT